MVYVAVLSHQHSCWLIACRQVFTSMNAVCGCRIVLRLTANIFSLADLAGSGTAAYSRVAADSKIAAQRCGCGIHMTIVV